MFIKKILYSLLGEYSASRLFNIRLCGIDAAIDQPGDSNNLTEPELEAEATLSNQFAPHDALRYFKIRAYWYKKHLRCTKKKVRYNCR